MVIELTYHRALIQEITLVVWYCSLRWFQKSLKIRYYWLK